MATVTIKGFVHKYPSSDEFNFYSCDMTEYGQLLVGPHEFEYTVPNSFNEVVAEVSTLKKKLDTIKKEHTDKVRVIERRINDLLCLENKPSQTADVMPDEVPF